MRLDARVGESDQPHRRLEPELGRDRFGRQEARGGAVREPRGVAGGDAAACPERRAQRREALERRVRTEELVAGREPPAVVAEHAHRHDRPRHHAVLLVPGAAGPELALHCVPVCRLTGQLRVGVVKVLGGLPHHGGALVDQPLAHEPRVELDLRAHRVVTHVLDAADDDEISRTHRDLSGAGRRRRQRAGAHAVDGEAGHRVRQAREERHVAPEREALVSDLRCRGEDDVADSFGRDRRVAAQQLAHDLDRHVVGARLPEVAVRPRLAERSPHPVDEHHLAELPTHAVEDIRLATVTGCSLSPGSRRPAAPVRPDRHRRVCDDCARRPAGRRRPPASACNRHTRGECLIRPEPALGGPTHPASLQARKPPTQGQAEACHRALAGR